jgi:hypothetical protein
MTTYLVRNIDSDFWHDLRVETTRRGVSIRALTIDQWKRWVKASKKLKKRERRLGIK